jgi:hypothetical protein
MDRLCAAIDRICFLRRDAYHTASELKTEKWLCEMMMREGRDDRYDTIKAAWDSRDA